MFGSPFGREQLVVERADGSGLQTLTNMPGGASNPQLVTMRRATPLRRLLNARSLAPRHCGVIAAAGFGVLEQFGTQRQGDYTSASPFVVSSPVPAGSTALSSTGTGSHSTADGSTVVYISLPPDAMPNGRTVTITNPHLGSRVSATFVDGGFDPVALTGAAGDTLMLSVQTSNAGSVSYMRAVPGDGPPIVVRTSPPPHKRDVPLNARMVVVFSQPINPATLSTESVQLRHNATLVAGTVEFSGPAGLLAEFRPDTLLAGNTEYQLIVTEAIHDVSGLELDSTVSVPFTTAGPGTVSLFTVGGTVTGLLGSGLMLRDNGGDDLTVTADGPFTFTTPLPSGSGYGVTVATQPANPGQSCTVVNGYGVPPDANVTNIVVDCATELAGLVFASVSAGSDHTCGVTLTGAAYCWGSNTSGELGDGTLANRLSPVLVAGGLTFTAVTAGGGHTCGVTSTGAAYCWGWNGDGELGDGTVTNRLVPVRVAGSLNFAAVTPGFYFPTGEGNTCGVTTAGAAYCWGLNSHGQLGDGTTTNRSSPVRVSGGLTFTAVTAGGDHTCAVTAAGAAYCWGENDVGQVGDGTTADRLVPVRVTGGLTFATLTAGSIHTCAVTVAGDAYCWGSNYFGEGGDTTGSDRSSPVPVASKARFVAVTASYVKTCGLTVAGAAYCWGDIYDGQSFDGVSPYVLPTLVPGSVTFAAVTSGLMHTCGVTRNGTAFCWGANGWGQLGDGTTSNGYVPVKVAGQP